MSVETDGTSVGMDGASVETDGASVGMLAMSVGMDGTSVGMLGVSVGMDGMSVGTIGANSPARLICGSGGYAPNALTAPKSDPLAPGLAARSALGGTAG